ncbi:MAG: hypothetical protein A2498_16005 [Lentisphaerae bacterium RIFOXYC12_FULL_60_16]|nr:MAG: hypothetical protein A2498_16005 [Lentisphaerae bacterium RIFOXYC12_FULL_60_16]OGV86372.1 MAG: hypothetical protein A2340_00655 [Lentisphaerae bacterium RIFOXYB12_FULL_60_10]
MNRQCVAFAILFVHLGLGQSVPADPEESPRSVVIGLNYPQTGPYMNEGLDQWNAAHLAADEINNAGGILGARIRIAWRDTKSDPMIAVRNAVDLIEKEHARMLFGGASSDVAAAVGAEAQKRGVLFFATLSYSTDTTCEKGHRYMFRECHNSLMSAKALSYYLTEKFPGANYQYITADYAWGHTTEAAIRTYTDTTDKAKHPGILIPFPGVTDDQIRNALEHARVAKPRMLVLVLFGSHMTRAVRIAHEMGIKQHTQIIGPNLTSVMAESAGPEAMEDVMGTVQWCWNVPYDYNYPRGREFVEAFAKYYGRYPGAGAASAYTILYEYKSAVERVGSFDPARVIRDLEASNYKFLVIEKPRGHEYTLLKDKQVWRAFDHQSLQTVYVVKCRPPESVGRDRFKMDYFEIIGSLAGDHAERSLAEWQASRAKAGMPGQLERLSDHE